ncbi:MAG: DUF4276 family protein [Oscillospiraceae bacterium]|nr:DUF4276 family protein [Oscillospiraceae bacterium]
MKLLILCEGETEERFVKDVLAPYLEKSNIYAIPKNLGGVSKYSIIRTELDILCRDSSAFVTTMLDYYKLPKDTPGKGGTGDIYKVSSEIEAAVKSNLAEHRNLLVNLIIHEFEGLLFSDVSAFLGEAKADDKTLLELAHIKNNPKFPTPEHINNSEMTAPSKRIKGILPEYVKTLNGIPIAKRIGIEKIAEECQHFRAWLENIQALGQEGTQ